MKKWILKISFPYEISSRSRINGIHGISSLSKKTETEMGSTWKDGLKMLFLKTSRMLATNLSVPVLPVFIYFLFLYFFHISKGVKWGENVSHQSASLDLASVFLYFCISVFANSKGVKLCEEVGDQSVLHDEKQIL